MLSSLSPTFDPAAAAARDTVCRHCGNVLASHEGRGFCCSGCETVHGLLERGGLLRYYDLREAAITPPAQTDTSRRDRNWLPPLAARLRDASGPIELTLKLQGLRCTACVWLVQRLFEREPGAHQVVVNAGRAVATLFVDARFPLARFVGELEAFGYVLGESERRAPESDELLLRTGVCLALGGNAMMYAAAIYFGLRDGPLYEVLHGLNFACATLAVLIGGPVFIRSAWLALRQGILHLDLPIAIGIVLSYAAAVWSYASGHAGAAYYDSLAAFIALMLLGRWLKERVIARNQQQLLADDGVDRLSARRIEGDEVRFVPATELRAGDLLIVPPGDLVPVAAELIEGGAACSLDWISGESEPVSFEAGKVVPAGAFNAGASPLRMRAHTDFAASELVSLLGRGELRERLATRRANTFTLAYVVLVLAAAAGSFVAWFWSTGSVAQALSVATAICVVTCPCAIGIATPLGEDLVLAGLRRAGLFVRSASFLDRALSIRQIVFDKTGTLTTGRLHLENPRALDALAPLERDVLYTLTASSVHPKSAAVARTLSLRNARLIVQLQVREIAGQGLETEFDGQCFRLGRAEWVLGRALEDAAQADLVFGASGRPLCTLPTAETLRHDVRAEIEALRRDGRALFILSGDRDARVQALARELGIGAGRALGGLSPQAKAAWIAERDRADLLMIGDGINDSLAVQQAFASGTPSIDRAFMPWRSDFYFVTAGLAPIRLALRAAERLARVIRANRAFAITYNAGVVALAMAGWMRPWLAAVLMPLSSIVVLAATSWSLSGRSSLWKS